ncbi:MmcQ/YjbR family DNA-binding protein [Sphingomonas adhaesiva]|uniref:MmcQ/YjbR family DNA-binding protein n=1 Tax=Sphingomonas adhaesiva TaxID=28212 RepID=UPI002FF7281F
MTDWDAVVATVLALPGAERGTAYGKPAVKMRGKTIAALTAPDGGSFVLHLPIEEKERLIDSDPATFWETDHYRGWPAVLVRFGSEAGERVAALLARSWWDRATVAQRRAFGERP